MQAVDVIAELVAALTQQLELRTGLKAAIVKALVGSMQKILTEQLQVISTAKFVGDASEGGLDSKRLFQ